MHGMENVKFESPSAPLEDLKTRNVNIPFKNELILANTKLLTQQSPKFHEHLTHVF
jgi:hypothetical protein